MGMKTRSARVEDSDEVKMLISMAYGDYIDRLGMMPGPMLLDYEVAIRDFSVTVACKDESIVGALVLKINSIGMLLNNVAVHPEYQGCGIGKRLMTIAEERAIYLGFSCITLYTHEKMVENVELYRRLGYLEFKRVHEFGYDRIYMLKNFR